MTRKEALTIVRDSIVAGLPFEHDASIAAGLPFGYMGPALHGSLDAARALHDAMLPGWEWDVASTNAAAVFKGHVINGPAELASADNPARAWLLAILEALIAQNDQ
jgi:hypothetical protein